MNNLILPGRIIFAVAMMAFGVLSLVYSDFIAGLEPVPDWVAGRLFLSSLTGIFFGAAGAAILIRKWAHLAAISLGSVFYLWVLFLQLPKLVVEPRNGGVWTTTFETLALGGAAWVLAGILKPEQSSDQKQNSFLDRMSLLGRFCFAISLPVFGILHFIYYEYVAFVIPAWIPAHLFWAYFTGLAQFAAGMSIITNIKARLAAILLGIMFGLWVLILHLPRAVVAFGNKAEWTSLVIALAMCGGALIIAGSFVTSNTRDE